MQGFLNLNKPLTFTSHDCVAIVRRSLGTKKVGHGGTLDPLATGVLPIAVGRATRLIQYLAEGKAYRAIVRFGLTTTTDDLEGDILTQQAVHHLTEEQVQAQLNQFLGTIDQIPPRFSAVQVDGKRLYDLARKGQAVEVPTRQVVVHDIELVNWQPGEFPEATLAIHCGPGTYIRSIARDLGAELGTGAVLSGLERTYSSGFDLKDSTALRDLESLAKSNRVPMMSPEYGVKHLAAVQLAADLAIRWRQGQKILIQADLPPELPHRVLDPGDRFLGIGIAQIQEDGVILVPKVVLEPFG